MAVRNIEKDDSYFLHKESRPVDFPLSDTVKEVIQDLKDTMDTRPSATGLAAPQIGSNVQVFVYKCRQQTPVTVMINPRIVKAADFEATPKMEMCLSYPSRIYSVPRYKRIAVHFQDENGDVYVLKYRGFEARILQHEIDHLHGLTIADKGAKIDEETTKTLLGEDYDKTEYEKDK